MKISGGRFFIWKLKKNFVQKEFLMYDMQVVEKLLFRRILTGKKRISDSLNSGLKLSEIFR